MIYYRPIAMQDASRPAGAFRLAGGWCWFTHAERIERGGTRRLIPAAEIPADILARLTRRGLTWRASALTARA